MERIFILQLFIFNGFSGMDTLKKKKIYLFMTNIEREAER